MQNNSQFLSPCTDESPSMVLDEAGIFCSVTWLASGNAHCDAMLAAGTPRSDIAIRVSLGHCLLIKLLWMNCHLLLQLQLLTVTSLCCCSSARKPMGCEKETHDTKCERRSACCGIGHNPCLVPAYDLYQWQSDLNPSLGKMAASLDVWVSRYH